MLPMAVARFSSGRVTKSQNPKGKGQFWGLSRPIKTIDDLRCSHRCRVRNRRDHSIANNIMQQKESLSMPGKRK